jgi:hypothetical protein
MISEFVRAGFHWALSLGLYREMGATEVGLQGEGLASDLWLPKEGEDEG